MLEGGIRMSKDMADMDGYGSCGVIDL